MSDNEIETDNKDELISSNHRKLHINMTENIETKDLEALDVEPSNHIKSFRNSHFRWIALLLG